MFLFASQLNQSNPVKIDSSYSRYLPERRFGLSLPAVLLTALFAVVFYGGIGALFALYF